MDDVIDVSAERFFSMAVCSDGSSVPLYFHIIDENKQEIVDIGLLPEWDEAETLSDIMDWNDTDSSIVSTYNGKSCCQFYQMYNRAETKTCIAFLLISNQ